MAGHEMKGGGKKNPRIYIKDNNRGMWKGVGQGGKSEIGPKSVQKSICSESASGKSHQKMAQSLKFHRLSMWVT